jgi:hypothetical protein
VISGTRAGNSKHRVRADRYAEVSIIRVLAYFQKARTVEPEKQPLLVDGCVTCNSGITVGSFVFRAVHAEAV